MSCLESVGELRVGGLKRKIRDPGWISGLTDLTLTKARINFLVCG